MISNTVFANPDSGMKNDTAGMITPRVRTPAQIAASRRNGALSRGPVTVFGKMTSRRNAIKLGLFSSVLPPIDTVAHRHKDFRQLVENLTDDFQPATQVEQLLVESLALNTMRLRTIFLMDKTLTDMPPAEKFKLSPPFGTFEPGDPEQLQEEVRVLDLALDALTERRQFTLSSEEVNVVANCWRWLIGQDRSDSRSCSDYLAGLLKDLPVQGADDPSDSPDFRVYGLLLRIFNNQIDQEKLLELEPHLRVVRNCKSIQLQESEKITSQMAVGRDATLARLLADGGTGLETLARRETHVRKLIEHDLKMLVSLKQMREREVHYVQIPMTVSQEE